MKPVKNLHWVLVVLMLLPQMMFADLPATSQSAANAENLPSPTPYAITTQDGNSRVWERTTYELDPSGQPVPKKHSYTELATGLNHLVNGQWVESSEQIDILPNGTAVATNGQHQAYFPGDIYNGEIEMVTPDGTQLHSRPMGLSYFDGTNSVLIAELTNSIGILVGANQIIYPDAFTDFKADIRYTYTKAGFEQDIILREQPPAPESFGLNSKNTRLEVLTEFFDPPQPEGEAQTVSSAAGDVEDDNLAFGSMQMGRGKAFMLGENSPLVSVNKQWLNLQGRQFLVEEVPFISLANELGSLPLPVSNASSAMAPHIVAKHRILTPQRSVKTKLKTMLLAKSSLRAKGLVLDYVAITSQTNYTFRGDTTYYISGTVNLLGTNIFEGDAVLKYATNATISFNGGAPPPFPNTVLNLQTAAYRPVILTAMDDNSVGDAISGSTGTPTNYYANPALSLNVFSATFTNFCIYFAKQAVSLSSGSSPTFQDCRFVNCQNGISGSTTTVNFKNSLFANVQTNFNNILLLTVKAQNVTFGSSVYFARAQDSPYTSSAFYLTNCLLVNVTNLAGTYTNVFVAPQFNANYNGFYDSPVFGAGQVTNIFYPFQSVGAGDYYLTNGCSFFNAGTTNIDPALLADIQTKTTYPPILYSNVTVSVNTTLSPQAQRDTDTPDLGYHYDPLDYLLYALAFTNNVQLTINSGTAIANYNTAGIWLQDGSSIVSTGTPLNPNWFVRYQSVQEQPVSLDGNPPSDGWPVDPYHFANAAPNGTFQFTKFACPAGGGYHLYDSSNPYFYSNLLVEDCELWGGKNLFGGYSNTVTTLNNNLFWRSAISSSSTAPNSQSVSNNLFFGISTRIMLFNQASGSIWYAFNNAFDTCLIAPGADCTNGYNAYINSTNRINIPNAFDIIVTNAFVYQTGPLGAFYQPTNSPLIHMGSTTADQVGLYHYTVTTNEVIEGDATVSIGYHYVATDTNGIPLDTLWFGIPDYLADNNGALGIWEMKYFGYLGVDPNADPNGDGLSNLQDYLAGLIPINTMVVAWGSDASGQCDVPVGLTNAIDVAGGYNFSLALKSDSTVVAWGDNTYGETTVPAGLTNVISIAAGGAHVLALLQNGTVVAWGDNNDGQTNVPIGLTNVTAIAAGDACSLALRSDGSVVAWGYNFYAQTNVPATGPISQIAAGVVQGVALLTNSTVTQWGNYNGSPFGWTVEPSGLSNVVSIAAGAAHTLAVNANGTVTAWGAGATDTGYENDGQSIVPAGLSNVVAVAGGYLYSMALQSAGTVVAWGDDVYGETDLPDGLTGVRRISAGGFHGLAVRYGQLMPVILQEPDNQYALAGGTVTFLSEGAGVYGVTYQWQFNGVNIVGATNASLTLTNVQATNEGSYQVIISDSAGSITSDVATFALVLPPQIISTSPVLGTTWVTNNTSNILVQFPLTVVATNAGELEFPLSYQWILDGTNITTAANGSDYPLYVYDYWPYDVPLEGSYSVAVSNAAGSTNVGTWNVRFLLSGMVAAWGADADGECDRPVTLTNTIALAAGEYHSVAVMDGGSVVQWGFNWGNVPVNLTNAVAVAAGYSHTLALRSDGTVTAWGGNTFGQTNVPVNVTNAIAVAAGGQQSLALLKNGMVVQWGQTNAPLPSALANVTAIASGTNFCLALLSNATVVAWGDDTYGQTNVPSNLTNVVAVAAGGTHALALLQNGTIVSWGDNFYGETNVPSNLTNVMAIAAGDAHSVALLNNGTVVAWGDNSEGQTNVPNTLGNIKLIAAGGNHTLATMFSSLVQYPVDVTKDLLLIYNTNSADSTTVLNYYLTHRPMISGANVLGIGCTNAETILPDDYTNIFVPQIRSWLTNNPTKRPQYVILFYDVPSRINTNNIEGNPSNPSWPSVQYQLSAGCIAGWSPFITSINFNSTNDCIAYINKLVNIGTNYSPGRLIISASSGGYGNTNYYFDDTESGYAGSTPGLSASNAVVQAGASSISVIYTNILDNGTLSGHITNGVNVAGYLCWGAHSALNNNYPTNGYVQWSGNSGWWIIETIESFNGQREALGQGNFIKWFASDSFGGTNYSTTPIGGVSHTDEPGLGGVNSSAYFGLWASGKNLAICAWNSRDTQNFQALGDPFVTR